MDSPPFKDRRRRSHAGLLDSAIRNAGQLISSSDLKVRTLAVQIMGDVMQVRREMPARRQIDSKSRKG